MSDSTYTGKPEKHPLPRGRYEIHSTETIADATSKGGHIVQVLEMQKALVGHDAGRAVTCMRCKSQCYDDGNYVRCRGCGGLYALPTNTLILDTIAFLVHIEVDSVYEELRGAVKSHREAQWDAINKAQQLEVNLKAKDELIAVLEGRVVVAEAKAVQLAHERDSARRDAEGHVRRAERD